MIENIEIKFEYKENKITLPINPENIEISKDNNNSTLDIVSLGEIVVQGSPNLAKFSISSVFWQNLIGENENNFTTTKQYVNWFKSWQNSKEPAIWTIESLGYRFNTLVESFSYDVRAGEEDDVYFELALIEYKPFGAKKIVIKENKTEKEAPQREETKEKPSKDYTVKKGDSLWGICKSHGKSGNDWNELYEIPENKKIIGNNPNLIYPGQVLKIPESWL